jgi:RNA polymerase sigma factor (sigma-70 family)
MGVRRPMGHKNKSASALRHLCVCSDIASCIGSIDVETVRVMDLEDIKLFSTIAEFRQQVTAFDQAKLRSWLLKYCRHHDGAMYEDLKQNVYAKLMTAKLNQVSEIRDLDRFIYGVCRNVGVDWLREKQKRARLDDTVKQLPEPASQRTPENTAIEKEQRLAVEWAIAQLPTRQREIYRLYQVHGHDMESIAREANCKVSTIRRTLYDAINNVRKFLSREESAGTGRSKK